MKTFWVAKSRSSGKFKGHTRDSGPRLYVSLAVAKKFLGADADTFWQFVEVHLEVVSGENT